MGTNYVQTSSLFAILHAKAERKQSIEKGVDSALVAVPLLELWWSHLLLPTPEDDVADTR